MEHQCDLVPSGEESILLGATLSELAQREAFSKWFLTSAKRKHQDRRCNDVYIRKEAAADSSATQSPAAAAGPAEDQACIKLQSAEQSELPQVAAAGTCKHLKTCYTITSFPFLPVAPAGRSSGGKFCNSAPTARLPKLDVRPRLVNVGSQY
eukprot:g68623.t1